MNGFERGIKRDEGTCLEKRWRGSRNEGILC